VLKGYFTPIHASGVDRFVTDASRAGVDGLITVDLPPEEDEVLRGPALATGLDVIRLATPTTDAQRLPAILNNATGFLYYVSVAGVTGTKSFSSEVVRRALARIRGHAQIPVAVGFGIRTPEQAAEIASFADAVVVGSAIVSRMAELGGTEPVVDDVLGFCAALARSVHGASARTVVE
jgi:tryptophan synthase alpha chain